MLINSKHKKQRNIPSNKKEAFN